MVPTVTGAGEWCGCAKRVQVVGGVPPWCRPEKRAVRGEAVPAAEGAAVDAAAVCEIPAFAPDPRSGRRASASLHSYDDPGRSPAPTSCRNHQDPGFATVSWSLTGTAPVQGATDR